MGERIVRARKYSREAEKRRRAKRAAHVKRLLLLGVAAYLIGVTLAAVVIVMQ